jgi:SAM-dependent methyltransferase
LEIIVSSQLVYGSVNPEVLARVPKQSRRILDIGCGNGLFGQVLRRECPERQVVGITHSQEEAALAREVLDQVIVADLESYDFRHLGRFDCVICSHVLEHLRNPDVVLSRLESVLAPKGTVLIALPNVLHWRQRLQFLAGRFRYTEGGLMDSTHVVFFDWITARRLVEKTGLELVSCTADGGFPGARFLGALGPLLSRAALHFAPGLMGTQFILVAGEPALPARASAHLS